jgi:predicted house-cleaning noncanonical NTP pyrophosphatase (MazG superfamily)
MKDLKKKIDLFVSKVNDEYHKNIPIGGIIDTLIRPIFEGEYKPNYELKHLVSSIINDPNKSTAYSIFEKHFMKTNLRFKVLYNKKDVTTNKMKEQIPSLLNIIDESTYTSMEKINKHLFNSIEDAKNVYKQNNKILNPKVLTQLNSGKYFDSSFNGTNPTTNVRPILSELINLDSKLEYIKVPEKGFNNEMINAYL